MVKYFVAISICLFASWIEVFAVNKISDDEQTQGQSIRFRINSDVEGSDNLKLAIYDHVFDDDSEPRLIEADKDASGQYSFKISRVKQPVYIGLFKDYTSVKKPVWIFKFYLAEPGDDITIRIKKDMTFKGIYLSKYLFYQSGIKVNFDGRGSSKYQCKYSTDSAISLIKATKHVIDMAGKLLTNNFFDSCQIVSRCSIKKYRNSMSAIAINLLGVDNFSYSESERLYFLNFYHSFSLRDTFLLKKVLADLQQKTVSIEKKYSRHIKALSANYARYVTEKSLFGLTIQKVYSKDVDLNVNKVLDKINDQYSGELKDKIITRFVMFFFNKPYLKGVLERSLALVQTEYCKRELSLIDEHNLIGRPAYDFLLQDAAGKFVNLSNFKGKVVLIDFWFVDCVPCSRFYLNTLSKIEELFVRNQDVVFISINVDSDKQDWLSAVDRGIYTSTGNGVVNLYTNGEGVSHAIIKKYKINGYPSTLLIDKNGRIFCNDYELRAGGINKITREINNALFKK